MVKLPNESVNILSYYKNKTDFRKGLCRKKGVNLWK